MERNRYEGKITNKLDEKLAALNGMSDAFVGDILEKFRDMLMERTDEKHRLSIKDIDTAYNALSDVFQENDWDGDHRAIIEALEEVDRGLDSR